MMLCFAPRILLLLFALSLLFPPSSSQPFEVTSYSIPAFPVPVPGQLLSADAPSAPVSVAAATVTAAASTTDTIDSAGAVVSTDTGSGCTTDWCTQSGQWLPTNVNYILIAVAVGLLLFMVRTDRPLCAVLLCWACTLFLLFIVDEFVLWYIAVAVDFVVYFIAYGSQAKREDEDEEDAGEDDDEEDDDDDQQQQQRQQRQRGDTEGTPSQHTGRNTARQTSGWTGKQSARGQSQRGWTLQGEGVDK